MKNIKLTKIWSQGLYALAIFIISTGTAYAVVIGNLYSIETSVTDLSLDTRTSAFPRAFDDVLVKVTSSKNILEHPEVAIAKENIDKYIGSYTYKENPQSGMIDLKIQFNQQMIEQLLAKAGQTILGKNRPLVAIWLIHSNQEGNELIGSDTPSYLTNELERLAHNYAVPLNLPLLDLSERTEISEQDVADFNFTQLQAASKRYHADMIVVGKIQETANHWRCEWRLQSGEEIISWDTEGENLEIQLHSMFEHLGSSVIARYGVAPSLTPAKVIAKVQTQAKIKNGVTLRVRGVNNIEDYARISKYLSSLTQVKKVELSDIQTDEAVFLITADGGKESLSRAISLDSQLIADVNDLSSANMLFYKVNS